MGRGSNSAQAISHARNYGSLSSRTGSVAIAELKADTEARIASKKSPSVFRNIAVDADFLGNYLDVEQRDFFYNSQDIPTDTEIAPAVRITVKANKSELTNHATSKAHELETALNGYIRDKLGLNVFEGWSYSDPGDNPTTSLLEISETQRSLTASLVATAEDISP